MDLLSGQSRDRCILDHHIFTVLGEVSFRRATTDGMPVMIIPLGDREASVPLRSLQREFAIGDDTPDGRMLGLIAESLDYVNGLHLGDKLPNEVLTGRASWEPEPRYASLASTKLRLQLLAWLDPASVVGQAPDQPDSVRRLEEDPMLHGQVQAAFDQAATVLGLEDGAAVVLLVESLAEEQAYIEALREGLFRRLQAMAMRLERMARFWRGDGQRLETLTQVQRLTAIAIKQIGSRFDEVDAQTGEILPALRNVESQQAFIRSNRDWLYRCQRAWEPTLRDWDFAGTTLDDAAWSLIARTYQFLAPRYMPVTEWQVFNSLRNHRGPRKLDNAIQW